MNRDVSLQSASYVAEIEDVITGGLSISYEKSFSDAVEQSASVANSTTKSVSYSPHPTPFPSLFSG